MNTFVVLLGLLGIVWPSYGQTTEVQQCVRNGGPSPLETLPINTYIAGCSSAPCLLPQGQDAVINVIFKSPRVVRSMTTLATAYLAGSLIGLPYPLYDEAVTCNFFTNTYCPLVAEEVVQYTLRMPIETWMPAGTQSTVEFYIRDDSDQSIIACIRTSIAIVEPVESFSNST